MAEQIKGELKVVKKNDYGFYSVKIDNVWYGTGSKNEPSGVAVGDFVEGEFELEKGKYKTITKGGIKKSAPANAGSSSTGSSDKMSKADWAQKDDCIRYQHAQKVAASLLAIPAVLEAAAIVKAKPDAKLALLEALFDKFTAQVFTDIPTFSAVARNAGEAPVDPSAPPADDSDDE